MKTCAALPSPLVRHFALAAALALFPNLAIAAQQSTPPLPPTAAAESPLRKALKSRKVITNEDFEPARRSGPAAPDSAPDPEEWICDEDCQSTLRQNLGFGESEEASFQGQLAVARRDVARDSDWLGLLREAGQVRNSRCNVEKQKAVALSGQFASWYAKAKAEDQFVTAESTLERRLNGLRNRMGVMVDKLSPREPVRATLMQVQWERSVEAPCNSASAR